MDDQIRELVISAFKQLLSLKNIVPEEVVLPFHVLLNIFKLNKHLFGYIVVQLATELASYIFIQGFCVESAHSFDIIQINKRIIKTDQEIINQFFDVLLSDRLISDFILKLREMGYSEDVDVILFL